MRLYRSLLGTVTVQLTCADMPHLLKRFNYADIHIFSLRHLDELNVRITIYRCDLPQINSITAQKGGKVKVIAKNGIYWTLHNLMKRPVLVLGLLLLLGISCFLPSRILFVEVEGNDHIPTKLIMEQAQTSGIYFGASRRSVRSEQVKNQLLGLISQLQWAGVNTRGCVAVITVKERTDAEPVEQPKGVASIVAARDGIIQTCTATKGNLLCTVGQAVKAGQVLVSGYTDCGISIQATRAEGEITAQTSHELYAVAPAVYTQKGDILSSVKKYSLIIGKKRINFFKDSAYTLMLNSIGEKRYWFFSIGLVIASLFGIIFLVTDYLVSKKDDNPLFIKLLFVLLVANIIVTTLNTFVLRIYFPALNALSFMVFYIPRLVEEIIATILQAYIMAYLLKLLNKTKLIKF